MLSYRDDCAEFLLRVHTIIVYTFGYFSGTVYAFIRFILLCPFARSAGRCKKLNNTPAKGGHFVFIFGSRVNFPAKNRQFSDRFRTVRYIGENDLNTPIHCGPGDVRRTAGFRQQTYAHRNYHICFIAFIKYEFRGFKLWIPGELYKFTN